MRIQGIETDEKRKKKKALTIKSKQWKYLESSGYQDSLDRKFGKQKWSRKRWTEL